MSKLKALKPEAVVMTGYYQESAQLMIEMRKQGISCPILGSNGFNDPKILELAGKAMEGSIWASGFFPDNPDPKVRKFVAKVQEKYKKKPNQFHAQAYDALWVIAEAIKRAGVTENTPANRPRSAMRWPKRPISPEFPARILSGPEKGMRRSPYSFLPSRAESTPFWIEAGDRRDFRRMNHGPLRQPLFRQNSGLNRCLPNSS